MRRNGRKKTKENMFSIEFCCNVIIIIIMLIQKFDDHRPQRQLRVSPHFILSLKWYLFLVSGNDRFECLANNFKIMDEHGKVLFSASDDEVVVGADLLRVSGKGGTMFSGSVQTPTVRADSGHNLRFVQLSRPYFTV